MRTIYTLSRSKHYVVFLNWNQHCWDRWHAVTVVPAIEICVELVFIREMSLPIILIPSDRPIMAVPIFRSSDPRFFRQLRSSTHPIPHPSPSSTPPMREWSSKSMDGIQYMQTTPPHSPLPHSPHPIPHPSPSSTPPMREWSSKFMR